MPGHVYIVCQARADRGSVAKFAIGLHLVWEDKSSKWLGIMVLLLGEVEGGVNGRREG